MSDRDNGFSGDPPGDLFDVNSDGCGDPDNPDTVSKGIADTPGKVTKKEYRRIKSGTIGEIAFFSIVALLMSIIPGQVIVTTIKECAGNNSAGWLLVPVFAGGGFLILLVILYEWCFLVKASMANCLKARKLYLGSMSDYEKKKYQKRKKICKTVCSVCIVSVVCAFAAAKITGQIRISKTYAKAENLVCSGQFERASGLLKQIEEKDYKDTRALILLCEAKATCENENPTHAYICMENAAFFYQSDEMLRRIDGFKADLKEKYDQYCEEMEAQRQENLPKETPSRKPGGKGSKPYGPDVSDFLNPDDFYDWYLDDFSDYEEAENYYYAHGGR